MGFLNKYTLLGLFLIILSLGAKADFVSGEFELEGTCFDTVLAKYDFKNNWTETITYKLTAKGDGAEWVNVNGKWIGWETGTRDRAGPLVFELKPGETRVLIAYFGPCCYTKPGEYTIGLQYSSEKGVKTREIKFTVLESRKIELEIEPQKATIGQCEETEFEATVRNKSQLDETISLEFLGMDGEWLEIEKSEFMIEAGGEQQTTLKVEPGCMEGLGEYKGTARAKIKNTELFVEEDFFIEIIDKQEIKIMDREFTACNDVDEKKTITIKNSGRAEDLLALSIKGPDWVHLREKSVSLNAGEEKQITLDFLGTDASETSASFTLTAESAVYGKTTAKAFGVEVKDCYKLGIEKVSGAEKSCIENPLFFEFKAKNLSEKEVNVTAGITGLKAEIVPSSFSLEAGEEKTINAEFGFSGEIPGSKSFTLDIESENFSFSKEYGFGLEDCYAIEIGHEELCKGVEVTTGLEVCPQEKIITSTVKNTGTKSQVVLIEITGLGWVFVEPEELALNPGEEKEFYTYFIPPVNAKEGTFTVSFKASAKDFLEKAAINVKVKHIGPEEEIGISAESEIEEEIIETKKTVKARINLVNTGSCKLSVSGITAPEGVSFDFESFELDVNEKKTITATIFLGEETEAEEVSVPITITTDRGVIKKELNVSLKEETAEVGDIEGAETPAETGEPVEAEPKIVEKRLKFRNTMDKNLVVTGIHAEGFEAEFEPSEFELDTNQEIEITAKIKLDSETTSASVPIVIETKSGIIRKTLEIGEEGEAVPAGFVSLNNKTVNMVILVFLAIVAIVIVILAWHAYQKPAPKAKKSK